MVRHDFVGKKLEEYREIKPYWIKQIMKWLNSGERNGIRKWVSVLNNIVKVECMHFWSDWTDIKEIEINLDEYVFFEIDYRGKDSWHIKGHKCNSEYHWTEEELSDHQVSSIYDIAKFISQANAYDSGKFQPCKVSRFNNLHYSDGFYKDLQRLFELVTEIESLDCKKIINKKTVTDEVRL